MEIPEEMEYWRIMSDQAYIKAQDLLELSDKYFSMYMDLLTGSHTTK
jgi:hypothetical protein